ncbi:SYCY2 protein, partial [Anseranas semipalmata]|nr:SYCY2 protein [Anseranas semipalmata]
AFRSFARWFIPCLGVSELEKAIINISAVTETIRDSSANAVSPVQEEVSQLAKITMRDRMALDVLSTSQGGLCTVVNTSCCVYIDQSGRVATNLN